MKRIAAVRAVLSTLLIIIVLFLAFTGALLYFGKTGLVWGISRYTLRGIHFAAAILMCLIVVIHFVVNRKIYVAGIRALTKRDGKS
ncbi:MAG: DUF4405 domain-containing protein [Oscillospiraceae bacterium]|nr:DUF4405 domain-containing protein [Oscillospiraceae bacterium]